LHRQYLNMILLQEHRSTHSFATLLLEVECNCREITKDDIKHQFLDSLQSNTNAAKAVFYANLDNILEESLKRRNLDEILLA